jgi:histidinol phosphatase-like PHP family hydrolase
MKINWSYHIHTSYTHGQNSVEQIAAYCKKLKIQEIAITEHVRRKPSYQFNKLRNDIINAAEKHDIQIFTGIEAKILPDGSLDAPIDILSKADVVIGSVHSWPENKSLMDVYTLLVKSPATIIGHPKIVNEGLIRLLIKYKKVMEVSYKYPLNDKQLCLIQKFPKLKLSFGTDAHQLADIKNAQEYFYEISKKYNFTNQLWKIGKKV